MYMAIDRSYLYLVFVFICVILVSVWVSTTNILPANEGLYHGHYNYEPFTSIGYSRLSNSDDDVDAISYSSQSVGPNVECKKVIGFDGLFCSPTSPEQKIDTFSNDSGSLECKSSGLANSKGPLCLTQQQYNLLSTRGQNSAGRDSQIGSR